MSDFDKGKILLSSKCWWSKNLKEVFLFFQLTRLQSTRRDDLRRLRNLVRPIAEDKTITLDTSWNAYFQRCLDWASNDGKTASLSVIGTWCTDAQRHVRDGVMIMGSINDIPSIL